MKLWLAIAPAVVCAVKFVNSFASRQQLFDIAQQKRLTSIRIFSSILLVSRSCANFAKKVTN